ncbi:MAG: flagellin, partial [Planctomycetota bacterium]
AESSIRDADFAKETASLTRSQILVQSGTAVLGIANQSSQSVLSLLRYVPEQFVDSESQRISIQAM